MESGGRILLYVKNRSRETLFCTGHWLKLRFTKQFLASIRNLHFIPTSRHSERIHKIYILPSNFCSSKREDSFFFFYKGNVPRENGKYSPKAQLSPLRPPFFILEEKTSSFHPRLFSSSPHLSLPVFISIPIVSSSRTMPKPGSTVVTEERHL